MPLAGKVVSVDESSFRCQLASMFLIWILDFLFMQWIPKQLSTPSFGELVLVHSCLCREKASSCSTSPKGTSNKSRRRQIKSLIKILCCVMDVRLKAEPDTDEVFAQVILLPLKENENQVKESPLHPPPAFRVHSFCKTLTASDTSTHGGFSVLRRHADECLPPLDMSRQPPTQELVAKDLHGIEWRFRHIFRGQPRRHLLQSGWSVCVSSKRLVAGDAFIFLRGENGELRVGVRRAMRRQGNVPSSVISSHSMHLGVLATAWHAYTTGTILTVYYKPRTSPAEFIIPFNQYMESVKNTYSIGMKFKMSSRHQSLGQK